MDNVTITVPTTITTTGAGYSPVDWTTATITTSDYTINGTSTGTSTNLILDNTSSTWFNIPYVPYKPFEQLGRWNFDSDKGFYVCSNCGSGDYCVDPYEWVSCPWCKKSMVTKDIEGNEIEIRE